MPDTPLRSPLRTVVGALAATVLACAVALAGCADGPDPDRTPDGGPREGVLGPAAGSYADLHRHTAPSVGEDLDPEVRSGVLWFASTRHGEHPDLYRVHLDGRSLVRLTTDPAADRFPRLSPDGTRLAFASDRTGAWEIWTLDLGSGALTQVTADEETSVAPAWSPDGSRILYSGWNRRAAAWELRAVAPTGGPHAVIGPDVRPGEGAFLPDATGAGDGVRLTFQRAAGRGEPVYGVWTSRMDGSVLTQVHARPSAAAVQPRWSPDGAWILFGTVGADPRQEALGPVDRGDDLWVVRPDGSDLRRLTETPWPEYLGAWGDDGRIYFVGERDGPPSIWSIPGPRD